MFHKLEIFGPNGEQCETCGTIFYNGHGARCRCFAPHIWVVANASKEDTTSVLVERSTARFFSYEGPVRITSNVRGVVDPNEEFVHREAYGTTPSNAHFKFPHCPFCLALFANCLCGRGLALTQKERFCCLKCGGLLNKGNCSWCSLNENSWAALEPAEAEYWNHLELFKASLCGSLPEYTSSRSSRALLPLKFTISQMHKVAAGDPSKLRVFHGCKEHEIEDVCSLKAQKLLVFVHADACLQYSNYGVPLVNGDVVRIILLEVQTDEIAGKSWVHTTCYQPIAVLTVKART
eukprot:TRINITY_DN995_c0_g1_i2.p1 TRINITY_DN995_c0_g1~~TRINITY_DN995_c0_g1_i2.p1  ORF type:complete len:302 (+),score=18.67 TRINITY_DN995_c0_g1_i2:32-907(+)